MNAPKLRFKEFNNNWELKLFEELYGIKNGLNKEKEAFGSGTPIINYMDVNKNTFIETQDIKGKVNLTESEIERFLVKNNDLFFTRTSETSEEIGLTCSYIGENTNLVFSGFVLKASPKIKEIDSTFYSYYLRSFNKRKEIIKHSSITTRALTSGTLLSSMPINYTAIEEQQKIAKFLQKLDYKIKLQQEKIDLLKEQKKGYMQKIFSQELRFKNADGMEYPSWKKYSINEVAICLDNQRRPLNASQRSFMEGDIPYYGANGVVGYVNDYIFDEELILLAEDGGNFDDFMNRPIAQYIQGKAWVNNHAHILKAKSKFDNKFLFYSLEHKDIRKYINGTSRAKLNQENMMQVEVAIPSSIKEQQIISDFLSSLDKKIKLQQNKLNLLIDQRQAFMQQMFI